MIGDVPSADTTKGDDAHSDYALADDVVFLIAADDSGRLLDFGGDFHALSPSGTRMLDGVLKTGARQTVLSLATHYHINERILEEDLSALLLELEARGLLRRARGSAKVSEPGRGPWMALTSWLSGLLKVFIRSVSVKSRCLLVLARFSFARLGWSRTIAAWTRIHPLSPVPLTQDDARRTALAVDAAVRFAAARLLLPVGCKERALCCWALLRSAGVPAALVLGVSLYPLSSHAWCSFESLTLSDHEERCAMYTEIARYG
ncbi:MAG: lasso peptide biosynthesis B2 protein [Syntrophobacteraceae bacterium]